MEGVSRLFIIASLFYLAAGSAMGFLMAFKSGKWVLRFLPAHAHTVLVGWVSMLLFSIAYYMLPKVSGGELYSTSLSYAHFWLSNIGLIGMVSMWAGSRFANTPVSPKLVWPFGFLLVLSLWLFIFNAVMTLRLI